MMACIRRRVMESNSWLAIFQITDVFAQETRFNVPGSVGESNWSARLEKTVAEMNKDPQLLRKTQMFKRIVQAGRSTFYCPKCQK